MKNPAGLKNLRERKSISGNFRLRNAMAGTHFRAGTAPNALGWIDPCKTILYYDSFILAFSFAAAAADAGVGTYFSCLPGCVAVPAANNYLFGGREQTDNVSRTNVYTLSAACTEVFIDAGNAVVPQRDHKDRGRDQLDQEGIVAHGSEVVLHRLFRMILVVLCDIILDIVPEGVPVHDLMGDDLVVIELHLDLGRRTAALHLELGDLHIFKVSDDLRI